MWTYHCCYFDPYFSRSFFKSTDSLDLLPLISVLEAGPGSKMRGEVFIGSVHLHVGNIASSKMGCLEAEGWRDHQHDLFRQLVNLCGLFTSRHSIWGRLVPSIIEKPVFKSLDVTVALSISP